mgnify:CR=1 FL=1
MGSNLSLTEFNGIFKDMQVSWFGEVFFLCLYLQNQYERELLFLHSVCHCVMFTDLPMRVYIFTTDKSRAMPIGASNLSREADDNESVT